MGASKNRGTPKWMVYNGHTLLKWMIWGYHYFRKHPHGALVQDVFGVYDSHPCIRELPRCIVEVKKGSGVTAWGSIPRSNLFNQWVGTSILISYIEDTTSVDNLLMPKIFCYNKVLKNLVLRVFPFHLARAIIALKSSLAFFLVTSSKKLFSPGEGWWVKDPFGTPESSNQHIQPT